MKKIFCLLVITTVLGFVLSGNAFALDKFLSYRNLSAASTEDYPTTPDVNFAIKQGYINTYLLTATVHKTVTVPTGAKFAVFSASSDIWVRVGGTAAIPAGDTTDGTGAELNPTIRYLGAETTIGIISGYAAKVSIMFYE